MRIWRRRRRWSSHDVSRAERLMRCWEETHPGQRVWFAHSPEEETQMREQYARANRDVAVVPIYPPWDRVAS